MNIALFTLDGFMLVLRWLHIFFGITWIGLLYYFNFVQGAFFAETDATTKSNAIQKLVPRALWWFRWGAMFTLITGLLILMTMGHQNPNTFVTARGILILTGVLLAVFMWFNVWFVIWPAQKVIIQSAVDVAAGKPANPQAAALGARATVASRTNVLFSIPMIFFMASSTHLPLFVNPQANLMVLFGVIAAIVLALEFNALKGKTGPMTTVKGVIHCGFGLAVVLYALMEVLTK